MKKSIQLKSIITCFVTFLVSVLLSITFYVFPAKAVGGEVFEVEYGASVKLTGDGLRFKAKMDETWRNYIVDNDDVELWAYISYVEKFDEVANYEYSTLGVKVGGKLDESKIYQGEDGYYYANAVITDLDAHDLQSRSFSATFFVKQGSNYTYADMAKEDDGKGVSDINNQNRTQYYVLNAATLDGKKNYETRLMSVYGDWYGTEEYPIIVHNATQYNALLEKANDAEFAEILQEKAVFVKQGVGDTSKIGARTVNEGHIVTFYDGNKIAKLDFVADGASAVAPEVSRAGYDFMGWVGNYEDVTQDTSVYAKWKFEKADKQVLDNMTVYGTTRADGGVINSSSDVIGNSVILASGDLGDGAYYPEHKTDESGNITDTKPTDPNNTADQAYIAYNGYYGFNDYFVADFTGKNMPTLAFFADNYDKSIFYGNGGKNGVVVSTGFTWPDGRLFDQGENNFATTAFNGKGLVMYGPHMIYNTGRNKENNDGDYGVKLHGDVKDVALGRANLVDGKQYKIIMGMQAGADSRAIKLVYALYDLDTNTLVETAEYVTYNFFTDDWLGKKRDDFCQGSIVAYGYFGTPTVLDKAYGIYEDTDVKTIAQSFGLPLVTAYKSTYGNDKVVLEASNIGNGANYLIGQNSGGYVDQSYLALDGNYGLGDYIALDFTGKNMPEIAFFAQAYDHSMYASEYTKRGIVVASGITDYEGNVYGGCLNAGKEVRISSPYMVMNFADNWMQKTSATDSALGRANLVDGTQYRVIMGFEGGSSHGANGITLHWQLFDLDTNQVVENGLIDTWGFFNDGTHKFDDGSIKVDGITLDDLVGSIVLYGRFGVNCTIDKLHGVFENSSIAEVSGSLGMNPKTVTFKNYDGTVLSEEQVPAGLVPAYTGEPPVRPADVLSDSYTFIGWDKELTAVTGDVTYTAIFTYDKRDDVTFIDGAIHNYGVDQKGEGFVLKSGNIGNGANFTQGAQSAGHVYQSFLALDGDYGLGDFVMFDFTGANMPEIAFFAKNYYDTTNNTASMYADGFNKQGIVVMNGITFWNGTLYTDMLNGSKQVNIVSPYMITDATVNWMAANSVTNSMLGRANLVNNPDTHYRVVMGFESGSSKGGNGITLRWALYNLDTDTLVEEQYIETWGFFNGGTHTFSAEEGGGIKVKNMTLNDLVGSIVFYGKFGTPCTIDKLYGVIEDTTLSAIKANFGQTATVKFQDADGTVLESYSTSFGSYPVYAGLTPEKAEDALYSYEFAGWDKKIALVTGDVTYTAVYTETAKSGVTAYNTTAYGNAGVVLGNGTLGNGAGYVGPNANDLVDQAYFALDGDYGLGDYLVLDFTGKNMPEIAFFAKKYNNSMYYQYGGKQGIVVASGITQWNGALHTGILNGSKQVAFSSVNMLNNDFGNRAFESVTDSKLARANLGADTPYRVVIGFKAGSVRANGEILPAGITLQWALYNLDTNEMVEEKQIGTWGFFTGTNADVNNMSLNDLVGSIVLYGKFAGGGKSCTCTIDRVWDVYENTDIATVIEDVMPTVGESGGEEQPADETLGYAKYTDTFDFYAYSAYSDGTYEINGEKYYVGKNLANLKQYAQYGEAGMTIYFAGSENLVDGTASTLAKAKRLIDDLAKVGIHKTILQDNRILYLSLLENGLPADCDTDEELDAYIYNCVKEYATWDGVYGIQLGDEPKYACLDEYSAVYKSIQRVNAKYGFNLFVQYNLNPLNFTEVVYDNYYPATEGTRDWSSYWLDSSRYTACVKRYTQYINDFLDAMQPDSIMYDDYPLMENKNGKLIVKDTYIPCLQIVTKAAAERNVKFYNVTQAFENNADGSVHRRYVTEAGAKWLNNILIGFGAKQIAYYTYYTRGESDSSGGESYVDGSSFVDYNGNPTELYYSMQGIMADNQNFASTVLQFNYVGSRSYQGSSVSTDKTQVSRSLSSSTFTKLSNFSVDKELALVTELYDDENNNYMYMAMNISNPDVGLYTQNVTLTFNGYTHARVFRDGVFTNVALTGGGYSTSLNAGEAVYVIPYNN